jgi:multiple sugar transport system permease protein
LKISRAYFLSGVIPVAVVFAAVLVFPLLYVLFLMFRDDSLLSPDSAQFVGFANFERVLQDARFWEALLHSGIFSSISLIVSIPLGILLALYLSSTGILPRVVRTLVIIPMVLAPLVVGSLFRFLLDSNSVIPWLGATLGFELPPLLSTPGLALLTIAVVDAWQWTPLVGIIVYSGIQALNPSVYEAAKLDGASRFQEVFYIVLPQLRPLLVLVILIRFMDSFREFDKVFIMSGGGPGTSSETLPVYLWRFSFQYLEVGYSAAVGFLMLLMISIVSAFIVKFFKGVRSTSE